MNEIIHELENYLTEYDCIILLISHNISIRAVVDIYREHFALENGRMLILTTPRKEYENDRRTEYSIISNEKQNQLRDLYYTYEFSDKFIVIDESKQYGSLHNYVKAGII